MHPLSDEYHNAWVSKHEVSDYILITVNGSTVTLYPDEAARLRNALNWMIGPEVPHA